MPGRQNNYSCFTRSSQHQTQPDGVTASDLSDAVRGIMPASTHVKLAERSDHHPQEMSGGEQQRVAIARALINKPKILFADEPTANPDSVSSRQILELFRKLFWEIVQTILMVMHEPRGRRYRDPGDLG